MASRFLGGLAGSGSGLAGVAVTGGRLARGWRPGAGWPCYRLYNCGAALTLIT